jgi:hypothetical protein
MSLFYLKNFVIAFLSPNLSPSYAAHSDFLSFGSGFVPGLALFSITVAFLFSGVLAGLRPDVLVAIGTMR